tara:strand:+ start:1545 stop:2165 length:621 start_codon:yes stop_codon:yes gene_type:complete
MNNNLSQEALETGRPFSAPIPGQSLTNSPEDIKPWEQAPKITNIKEGIESTFLQIVNEDTMPELLNAISKQMPIADLASTILYDGYTKGVWNPDLMMLMLEPIMYMLIALSEKAGIDYILYRGDENEDFNVDEEEFEEAKKESQNLTDSDVASTFNTLKPNDISPSSVTPKVREMLENIDEQEIRSLLSKPQEKEPTNRSLLEAGE